MSLPVTVLIAVRNEEKNLAACLRSVRAMDQVVVVDSQSADGTVQIAEQMGAEVLQFRYDGGWPKKRNWALENAVIRNEWILMLDADERVSPELEREIAAAIGDAATDGYYIRWKFVFLGRWMKYSWSHGWMLRLFRRGRAAYEDLGMRGEGGWDAEVHENIVAKGACGRLKVPLVHESEESLSFWIAKQNQFSDWNARRRIQQAGAGLPPLGWAWSRNPDRRRRFLKALFLRCPCKPGLLFLYLYVWKRGFLDGRAGYYFCCLRAAHELQINAKIFELRNSGCMAKPRS